MSQINWFLILCLPNWDWQAALLGLWVLRSIPTCSFKSCLPPRSNGMIDQDTAAVGAMSEGGLSCVSWIWLESQLPVFSWRKTGKPRFMFSSFSVDHEVMMWGSMGLLWVIVSPSRPLQTVRWLNDKIGPRSWWHQRDSLFPKNFGMRVWMGWPV